MKECPAQLEAKVSAIHWLEGGECVQKLGCAAAAEVQILAVHFREDLVLRGN